MKCPRCEHDNEAGAKFCEECATPLARACTKCGRQLSPAAKFCRTRSSTRLLMLKIAFHDNRKRIYDSLGLGRLVGTPAGALAFMDRYIDRTEGRPTKRIEKTVRPAATFVFTTKDGAEVPALPAPQKVGGGATPAAVSAEDQFILLEPVRPW
jgi:hypothetical protein